jgi:putative peptidoglycan lipid II flippase
MSEVAMQFAPLLASSLLLGGSSLIDNAMAAGLEAGSVSVLNFGTKLATVISTIGPAAVGTAVLPHLSGMAARGEWQTMRRNLMSFATLIIAAAIPLTALLIVFSEPLVRLAFEKGAFTASATRAVAMVQSFSLLQVPFAALIALGFRLTASLRANNLLPPVAAVGLGVTAAGDFLLRQVLGVAGIALTATFSQIAMILTLAFLLTRRIRRGGGIGCEFSNPV